MTTPQLITYIQQQRSVGFSDSAIRKSLVFSGWAEEDLVEAFAHISSLAIPQKPVSRKRLVSAKIPFAVMIVFVAAVYALWQQMGGGQTAVALADSLPAQVTPAPSTPKTTTVAPATQTAGQYVDGTYTGTPVDAYYGIVQVEAVVQNGKLADVKFLQSPKERSTSLIVNGQAMPVLIQEAIAAQSAQVDTASGATFTSQAFQKSLASALAQAKS